MQKLVVRFFGSPNIEVNGQPVAFGRRKAIALLAYLMVEKREHRRESLANLFWPDAEPSKAFAYLRTTLWALNKALDNSWLEISDESVCFKYDEWVESDVEIFQSCIEKAYGLSGINKINALIEAVDLYNGLFLSGFTISGSSNFDDWQYYQSNHFEQRVISILQDLTNLLIESGDYKNALVYAERNLMYDRVNEAVYRDLMRLYYWMGQRTAALRMYEKCVSVLEQEFGVKPEEATISLNNQIQKNILEIPAKEDGTTQQPRDFQRSRNNLPHQTTAFIGRKKELEEIINLLKKTECRLVTLLGWGGIGKTRLAIEAGFRLLKNYQDGAFFVPFAPVLSTDQIVQAISDAVDFSGMDKFDQRAQLLNFLSDKYMLLIFDNFENLIEGSEIISEILSCAKHIRIIVTSRERLQLSGEWIFEVPGLSYPEKVNGNGLINFEAVRFFIESARRVKPDFDYYLADKSAIAQICQLVEGMPLGLEIAAGWVQILTCREIADEIDHSLDFLTSNQRDIPQRHLSIRAVMESSYLRLQGDEQQVLQKLSVFNGGFTREAASSVGQSSLHSLLRLMDKSLIKRNFDGRFEMHELLRQFAFEKLTQDREMLHATQNAHAEYFSQFLKQHREQVYSHNQIRTLNRIEEELDNIRAAWGWIGFSRQIERIECYALYMLDYFLLRNKPRESADFYALALKNIDTPEFQPKSPEVVAFIKSIHTIFTMGFADIQDALKVFNKNIPFIQQNLRSDYRRFYIFLGAHLIRPVDENQEAAYWLELGLDFCEKCDDAWGSGYAFWNLGNMYHNQAKYIDARKYFEKALEVSQSIGDRWVQAGALSALGETAYTLGDYQDAERKYRQVLDIWEMVGDPFNIAISMGRLGHMLYTLGKYEEAKTFSRKSLDLYRDLGLEGFYAWQIYDLGVIALKENDLETAENNLQESYIINKKLHDSFSTGWTLVFLSRLAMMKGDFDAALARCAEGLESFQISAGKNWGWGAASCHHQFGEIYRLQKDNSNAWRHYLLALDLAKEVESRMLLMRFFIGIGALLSETGYTDKAISLLALVENHHASWHETKQEAAVMLKKIKNSIKTEDFKSIYQQGAAENIDDHLERLHDINMI
jgi:predicted ATPase/DNA-binding SARP family transcriptional activator